MKAACVALFCLSLFALTVHARNPTLDILHEHLPRQEQLHPQIVALLDELEARPDDHALWQGAAFSFDANGYPALALPVYLHLSRRATADGGDAARWSYHLADLMDRYPLPYDADRGSLLRAYRQAHTQYQDDYGFLIRFGNALLRAGELGSAADSFRQALNLDDTRGHAELGLAQVAWLRADVVRAERWSRAAQKDLPHNKAVYDVQLAVFRHLGRHGEAALAARRSAAFLKRIPERSAWRQLALHAVVPARIAGYVEQAVAARDVAFAQRLLDGAVETEPTEALQRARYRVLHLRTYTTEARGLAASVYQTYGRLQEATFLLSLALDAEDAQTARRWALLVAEHLPLDDRARCLLARWHLARGVPADALALLDAVYSPTVTSALLYKAMAHESLGQLDAAITARTRYFELFPEHEDNARDLLSAQLAVGALQPAWRVLNERSRPTHARLYVEVGAFLSQELDDAERQELARRSLTYIHTRRREPRAVAAYAAYLCASGRYRDKAKLLARAAKAGINVPRRARLQDCEARPLDARLWFVS